MGEGRKDALRVGFDRAIKLEFHGTPSFCERRVILPAPDAARHYAVGMPAVGKRRRSKSAWAAFSYLHP